MLAQKAGKPELWVYAGIEEYTKPTFNSLESQNKIQSEVMWKSDTFISAQILFQEKFNNRNKYLTFLNPCILQ